MEGWREGEGNCFLGPFQSRLAGCQQGGRECIFEAVQNARCLAARSKREEAVRLWGHPKRAVPGS